MWVCILTRFDKLWIFDNELPGPWTNSGYLDQLLAMEPGDSLSFASNPIRVHLARRHSHDGRIYLSVLSVIPEDKNPPATRTQHIVAVTRATDSNSQPIWICHFDHGRCLTLNHTDLLETWRDTGYDKVFNEMDEHDTLTYDDHPIEVTVTYIQEPFRRHTLITEVHTTPT